MTDAPKNPFAEMMALGQEWAKTMNPALQSFTPQGFEALFPTMPADLMETFMGKTFTPEGLDAKTKLLLTVCALTVMGAQAGAHYRAPRGRGRRDPPGGCRNHRCGGNVWRGARNDQGDGTGARSAGWRGA